MPPENNKFSLEDCRLCLPDGTEITEIAEFVEVPETVSSDPDDFCPSLHFDPMEFTITLNKRQVKKLVKAISHQQNVINRQIRRIKRFKERMRRAYLKGGFGDVR